MKRRAVLVACVLAYACTKTAATSVDSDAAGDVPLDVAAVDVAAEISAVVDPCAADPAFSDPPAAALLTPRWAFEPWISKDISTADDTRAFVQGFLDRDIPVGVVVLDSPWETSYNTFVPNPARYPEFQKLTDEMHGKNVKVVVWLTPLVNTTSYDLEPGGDTYDGPAPNFAEGQKCGHFINKGETQSWWKGDGAAVDFFHPAARTWWNRQQVELLKQVDGYKLDFGEMYITTVPMQTSAGQKTLDDYSQAYYHQMLAFGVQQKGAGNFVTMVRPWDESYGFPGRFFATIQDAPVAWVGDNRRDWIGLKDALNEMLISAAKGYTVIGSDIGGYLDRNDVNLTELVPFNATTFARWIAIGALGPFMELHGRANLTPWTTPDHQAEITAAYKYWAQWHHQFVPMLYSEVRRSQLDKNAPVMMLPASPTFADDWSYLLANRWFVAPLTDNSGKRAVHLPKGHAWLDWWNLAAAPLPEETSLTVDFSQNLQQLPLYLDACSIQPFQDATALTGLAPPGLKPLGGWLIAAATPTCSAQFQRTDVTGPLDAYAIWHADQQRTEVTLLASPQPTVLLVRTLQTPKKVTLNGAILPPTTVQNGELNGWLLDPTRDAIWIGLPANVAVTLSIE